MWALLSIILTLGSRLIEQAVLPHSKGQKEVVSLTLAPRLLPKSATCHLCSHFLGQCAFMATYHLKGIGKYDAILSLGRKLKIFSGEDE